MARTYAPLLLEIWRNDEFLSLTASAQRTYFLAMSHPRTNYCGVVPLMPKSWSNLASDSSAAKIRADVKLLAEKRFVVLDPSTEELWVRAFIRVNRVIEQPNVRKAMQASYEHIASTTIRQCVYQQVPVDYRAGMSCPFPDGNPPPSRNGKRQPIAEGLGEGFTEPIGEGLGEPFGEPQASAQGYGYRGSVVVVEPQPEPEPSSSSATPQSPTPIDIDERVRRSIEEEDDYFVEAQRQMRVWAKTHEIINPRRVLETFLRNVHIEGIGARPTTAPAEFAPVEVPVPERDESLVAGARAQLRRKADAS